MTEPQTVAQPPKETKAAKTSEYVVLRKVKLGPSRPAGVADEETWEKVGFSKGNAETAIKAVAGEKEGVYVAIPARSFRPVKLATKTETRVTLS